jgi:hypothetical protein
MAFVDNAILAFASSAMLITREACLFKFGTFTGTPVAPAYRHPKNGMIKSLAFE